jgi:hypothetical protein
LINKELNSLFVIGDENFHKNIPRLNAVPSLKIRLVE